MTETIAIHTITDDTMAPRYCQGDQVLIDLERPAWPDRDCLVTYRQDIGQRRQIVGTLIDCNEVDGYLVLKQVAHELPFHIQTDQIDSLHLIHGKRSNPMEEMEQGTAYQTRFA